MGYVWVPSSHTQYEAAADGTTGPVTRAPRFIEWDGWQGFPHFDDWLRLLIERFLAPWGYTLNGRVTWQGEDEEDRGALIVTDNVLTVEREDAPEELEEQAPEEPPPDLLEQLKHADVAVRREAIAALVSIAPDHRRTLEVLRAVLREDAHEWVRLDAAEALGGLGASAREATPELLRALEDPNEPVAAAAVWSLGEIGNPSQGVREALERASRSPRFGVRFRAEEALRKLQ
ncbi:HEAT repeat domain-containing protein [Pyxidicoccus fallax]|uniref:HEAT repeat domain-containing protein n=1 Tax=Pyxidicoccus fallax TaxID=394095 RepID=A0A848LX97_9BACT|nr:HEAT repeat domain-containing protein [Pyxidicoccus fallax]NMO22172.1 HEAT repeat domain-containing protein [Pyxidicoccus fallax]NPC83793.1 HEAT repeat domain-containing protein [Pyxidicoccus fallax]